MSAGRRHWGRGTLWSGPRDSDSAIGLVAEQALAAWPREQ
jgi:hypothetical protein